MTEYCMKTYKPMDPRDVKDPITVIDLANPAGQIPDLYKPLPAPLYVANDSQTKH